MPRGAIRKSRTRRSPPTKVTSRRRRRSSPTRSRSPVRRRSSPKRSRHSPRRRRSRTQRRFRATGNSDKDISLDDFSPEDVEEVIESLETGDVPLSDQDLETLVDADAVQLTNEEATEIMAVSDKPKPQGRRIQGHVGRGKPTPFEALPQFTEHSKLESVFEVLAGRTPTTVEKLEDSSDDGVRDFASMIRSYADDPVSIPKNVVNDDKYNDDRIEKIFKKAAENLTTNIWSMDRTEKRCLYLYFAKLLELEPKEEHLKEFSETRKRVPSVRAAAASERKEAKIDSRVVSGGE